MSNTTFNVGDAVKVYHENPASQFYIIGRIIYIDTEKDSKINYGVIFYSRLGKNEIARIEAPANRVIKMPIQYPQCCPSHSFVMDYVDEIVRKEFA